LVFWVTRSVSGGYRSDLEKEMGPLYKSVARIVVRTTKAHSASGSGFLNTLPSKPWKPVTQ